MDRAAGFSILEVLLATLLLGVTITALSEGVTIALRSSKTAERQTMAVLVAESQMELLRCEPLVSEGTEEAEPEQQPGYRYIQEVSSHELDGLYEVRIDVFYGDSKEPLYRLETLLFDAPLSDPSAASYGGSSDEAR